MLRFDSETGVPQYDPDEGGIFVTGQVQRELSGTAWEPRLKVVEMGLHSPQRAAIESESWRAGDAEAGPQAHGGQEYGQPGCA